MPISNVPPKRIRNAPQQSCKVKASYRQPLASKKGMNEWDSQTKGLKQQTYTNGGQHQRPCHR